jgi:hypothetical protein
MMRGKKPGHPKLFLWGFFMIQFAYAQNTPSESLGSALRDSYPVQLYYKAVGQNAHIYNGYEYRTPDKTIVGSRYYLTDAMVPISLTYDEGYYQNIPAVYDLVLDLVVINRLDQNFLISLIPEKLPAFTIQNHHFVRITTDSLRGVELETGFYERLYDGKSTVLVKHKKIIVDQTLLGISTLTYGDENIYYVRYSGKYVAVGNKSAVLSLFKAKKSEIKTFIRKNRLNLKSEFEKTLVAVCAYYDQLPS